MTSMQETTVEKTLGGESRFSPLWCPIEPGEMMWRQGVMTVVEWAALRQNRVVGDEWRLEDDFGFDSNRYSLILHGLAGACQ